MVSRWSRPPGLVGGCSTWNTRRGHGFTMVSAAWVGWAVPRGTPTHVPDRARRAHAESRPTPLRLPERSTRNAILGIAAIRRGLTPVARSSIVRTPAFAAGSTWPDIGAVQVVAADVPRVPRGTHAGSACRGPAARPKTPGLTGPLRPESMCRWPMVRLEVAPIGRRSRSPFLDTTAFSLPGRVRPGSDGWEHRR
jgi:hypothetical protein